MASDAWMVRMRFSRRRRGAQVALSKLSVATDNLAKIALSEN